MRDELVAIVDEQDNEVGSAPRWRMRAENLRHRASFVFVFDRQGLLYAQHRTPTKDVFPGYWDLSAGGVVLAGESYEASAARELAEELGIEGVALSPWFGFYYEDARSRAFGYAFGCVYEGPLRLQEEEVQSVERLSVGDVLSGSLDREFTPDSLLALRRRFGAA